MKISQVTFNNQINNKHHSTSQPVNFRALSVPTPVIKDSKLLVPLKQAYQFIVSKLAAGIGKSLDNRVAKWVIEKTKREPLLFSHLMTFNSAILSGMYIRQTLKNKDLDEGKRKTLAINQAIVMGLSTIMCYTFDAKLNERIANFSNNYEAANVNRMEKEVLRKCSKGIGLAKSMMVFDMIYRFITPVIVTPIANHIGNKINEKHNQGN